MDFPLNPAVNQTYTAPSGTVYTWDGVAWVVDPFYVSTSLASVGDLLKQVRILLQDTDLTAGEYRYSTDSLVIALNQCMMEMFRIRPDLFLEQGFVIPTFTVDLLDMPIGIEAQYIPPIIYYVVG